MNPMRFEDVLRATGARYVNGDRRRVLPRLNTDTRALQAGDLFLSLRGPNFDGDAFAAQALARGAGALLLREAPQIQWPQDLPVAEHPHPRRALGDLARWMRVRYSGQVVGITGSCGKTSTKEILVSLLQRVQRSYGSPASYNNDVGVPLTLLGAPAGCDSIVVEMGTNAPGEIANLARIARPGGAILTNIGEAHLAGLGTAQGVAQEKGALAAGLPPDGFCVLNADSPFTPELRARTRARVWTFALSSPADFMASEVHFEAGATHFLLQAPGLSEPTRLRMPLLGSHMVQNVLAALAAVHGMGIPLEQVLPAVEELQPAVRRMQIHRLGDQTVIDDSYNANPLSVAAGTRQLMAMPGTGRKVLVVGDMLELGASAALRHREVGTLAARLGVQQLFAIGEFADDIAAGALEHGMAAAAVVCLPDGDAALRCVPGALLPGDLVLVKASRGMGLDRLVESLRRVPEAL